MDRYLVILSRGLAWWVTSHVVPFIWVLLLDWMDWCLVFFARALLLGCMDWCHVLRLSASRLYLVILSRRLAWWVTSRLYLVILSRGLAWWVTSHVMPFIWVLFDLFFNARLCGLMTFAWMQGRVAHWLVIRCKVVWLDDFCLDARLSGSLTCSSMRGCVAWWLLLGCKVEWLIDLLFDARLCGLMTFAWMLDCVAAESAPECNKICQQAVRCGVTLLHSWRCGAERARQLSRKFVGIRSYAQSQDEKRSRRRETRNTVST